MGASRLFNDIAMHEKNGPKLLLAFIAGAAVGAAIGYFLSSDKKDEVISDIKESASKLRNDLEENLDKVRDLVDNLGQAVKKTNTGESA